MTAGDWDWFEALNEWRDHDHRLLFVQSPFRHLTFNALVAQVPYRSSSLEHVALGTSDRSLQKSPVAASCSFPAVLYDLKSGTRGMEPARSHIRRFSGNLEFSGPFYADNLTMELGTL